MFPRINGAIRNIFVNATAEKRALLLAVSCAEANHWDAAVALRVIKKLLGSLGINLNIQDQWRFATLTAFFRNLSMLLKFFKTRKG